MDHCLKQFHVELQTYLKLTWFHQLQFIKQLLIQEIIWQDILGSKIWYYKAVVMIYFN